MRSPQPAGGVASRPSVWRRTLLRAKKLTSLNRSGGAPRRSSVQRTVPPSMAISRCEKTQSAERDSPLVSVAIERPATCSLPSASIRTSTSGRSTYSRSKDMRHSERGDTVATTRASLSASRCWASCSATSRNSKEGNSTPRQPFACALMEPMLTATPMERVACASSAPRYSPIRGTIQACRTKTTSANNSHAATSRPSAQRAVTAVILSRCEGGDAVTFIEGRAVSGIMTGTATGGSAETPSRKAPPLLSSYSRFVQRLRRRYSEELALLPAGEPRRSHIEDAYAALRERGHGVGDALRIARQLVMERLVSLDRDQQAELSVVTCAVNELAEFALDVACRQG